jgi:hypothetical protein
VEISTPSAMNGAKSTRHMIPSIPMFQSDVRVP